MPAYNLAANLRSHSPVGDMLDARAQLDTHKRAEAELPYVAQLLENRVEQGDQAIAREKTEAKYRPKALEQAETKREQEIQAEADAQKERERMEQFREDLKPESGLSREDIRDKYPILGAEWYTQQAQATAEALKGFTGKLDHLDTLPPAERNAAYQQMRKEMPPEAQDVMPDEYDEDAFAELRHKKDTQLNSFASQMLKEREYYRGIGDNETADAIDSMLLNYYSRNVGSTQRERIAQDLFSWAEKPMAALVEYERINESYTKSLDALIMENMKLSENDKLMMRMGWTDKMSAKGLEQVAKGREQYHDIALAALSKEDRDWFLMAKQKVMRGRGAKDVASPESEQGTDHYPGPYSADYLDKIAELRIKAGITGP